MLHFIYWIILGLVAGAIASRIVNKTGSGFFMDVIIGVVGAFVGGFIGEKLGVGPDGSIIWGLFLAVAGAVIVLVAYRAIASRS